MVQDVDRVQIVAERIIEAPAPEVYEYIANYREHHPRFLPHAFSGFVVEKGGIGSGTVVSFNLRVGGLPQRMRAMIDEPDPGRVLKEISLDTDSVTTFEVSPIGEHCRVTIDTEFTPRTGFRGWVERRLAPRMLGRLLSQELENLGRYAQQHAPARAERVLSGVSD